MSTKQAIFPRRKPADEPPTLEGEIVDGHPTPSYALAWVCDATTLYRNLGGGKLGEVHDCNFMDVISDKWGSVGFGYPLAPLPYPGPDGNFYLIALFNEPDAHRRMQARNLTQERLLEAARVALGVNLEPALESTLMWYRWPLHWLRIEERERRKAQLESESQGNELTAPPVVSVH